MVYEFKSRATGSVVMTGPVAERMLAIIGREPAPRGIITVAQLGPAIDALRDAVARERAEGPPPAPADIDRAEAEDAADARHRAVTLAQRAFPLIEMMSAALAADKDVTWGV